MIETSLDLPGKHLVILGNLILGNLWQSSEIFGKCLVTFLWPIDNYWKIFRNLW